jgi:hypothetical protein
MRTTGIREKVIWPAAANSVISEPSTAKIDMDKPRVSRETEPNNNQSRVVLTLFLISTYPSFLNAA